MDLSNLMKDGWRIVGEYYTQSVTRPDGIHVYNNSGLVKVIRYDGRELHLQPERDDLQVQITDVPFNLRDDEILVYVARKGNKNEN